MNRFRQVAGVSLAVALVIATTACREPDAPGTQGSPKDWNTLYTGTDTAGGTENNRGVARVDPATNAAAPAGTRAQSAPLTNAPVAAPVETAVTTTTATTTTATVPAATTTAATTATH